MASSNLQNFSSPLNVGKSYKLQYYAKFFYISIGSVTYSKLDESSSVSTGSYTPPLQSKQKFDMNIQVTGKNKGTIALNGGSAEDCIFSESGDTLTINYQGKVIKITKSRKGPVITYEGNKLRIRS